MGNAAQQQISGHPPLTTVNELDNVLTGNSNPLTGLAGADTLDGGAGALAEAANDEMFEIRKAG